MLDVKVFDIVKEGLIDPRLLKPHPKNTEFYDDLDDEKYREVRRSIEAGGIRTPLWILEDNTVVSGHQRLRIALELGLKEVPFQEIRPKAETEREREEIVTYLLIADNEERRQGGGDPVKVAKRAEFLAKYWEVGRGGRRGNQYTGKISEVANGQNVHLPNTDTGKTLEDIAKALGLSNEKAVRRILKLNDLIPEFQAMVSSGKLGTSAAEQVAYLSPEAQAEIYRQIREQITEMTVAEVKELRRKVEEKERLEKELEQARAAVQAMENRAIEAEDELQDVRRELSDARNRLEEAIEDARKEERKAAEEEIIKLQDKVNRLAEKTGKLKQDKEKAEAKVKEIEGKLADAHKAVEERLHKDIASRDAKIKNLQEQIVELNKKIAELESRPPEVVEKVPEDYEELKQTIKTLKKEKEKAESELLGLTREQIETKDRYWIRDIVTKIAQDVGKHVTKLRYEMERRSMDAVAYKDVMDCADLLIKIAGELRNMVSLDARAGGDYIEVVV
ncbi:MAG: ParB N-terminal domain-containing protein [Peptococcaceae bacterium MAG4]|nr:ParB N-terminal domain-containing protein [Peptococcaceae bacterium MAG4]